MDTIHVVIFPVVVMALRSHLVRVPRVPGANLRANRNYTQLAACRLLAAGTPASLAFLSACQAATEYNCIAHPPISPRRARRRAGASPTRV